MVMNWPIIILAIVAVVFVASAAFYAWLYLFALGLKVGCYQIKESNDHFARYFALDKPACFTVELPKLSRLDQFLIKYLVKPKPQDLMPDTVFSIAARFTPLIHDGRTDHDVLEHMRSEVDELQAEIDDPANPGPDGIFGEAIDVIACCVDIIRRHLPELTTEELEQLASDKMREKCAKWRRKAEAGEYPYQQR